MQDCQERSGDMNKVILMGRLTRDPEIRYSNGDNQLAIARYTLAVDRRFQKNREEQTPDYISCVTFGKNAEVAEKYFLQGTKLIVTGRIQTGSYINKEGRTVYTTEVVVEDQEFAESKNRQHGVQANPAMQANPATSDNGFINIPDGIDSDLPFT